MHEKRTLAKEAQKGGVKYVSGDSGRVTQLLFDETFSGIGARSANGSVYIADIIILKDGTAAVSLILERTASY